MGSLFRKVLSYITYAHVRKKIIKIKQFLHTKGANTVVFGFEGNTQSYICMYEQCLAERIVILYKGLSLFEVSV